VFTEECALYLVLALPCCVAEEGGSNGGFHKKGGNFLSLLKTLLKIIANQKKIKKNQLEKYFSASLLRTANFPALAIFFEI
jgi:hypothetical protein